MLTQEYFKKIKEAREVVEEIYRQEDQMVQLVEDVEVEYDDDEVNECAEYYLMQMLMEESDGEIPVYSLERKIINKKTREELHGTADVVVALPDDGLTLEALAHNPINLANFMEELSKEV